MQTLESICDDVAFAIDDVDGNLQRDQIDILVSEAIADTDYTREQFNDEFEHMYCCDVLQYAVNAIDDASWATDHGILDNDFAEFEHPADVNPETLGIMVEPEDEQL